MTKERLWANGSGHSPIMSQSLVFSRAGNSLICSSLICHFANIKWATASDSLRSLKTNERLWANCSGCSYQKSDREQIAQGAHDKWATVSDSLRSLMINEQFAQKLLVKILFFSMFYIGFLIFKNERFAPSLFLRSDVSKSLRLLTKMSYVSESLRLLTKNERCERIAKVAHQKWVTMSKSLRSLTKNERCERIARFFEQIAHSLIFGKKKSDSLRKPMSKFPALVFSEQIVHLLIIC